jgi:hypothetical protein
MAGTTAIIISPEVVLDTKVSLAEEASAEARAAVRGLTARLGAGVEGEEVGVDVDVSAPFDSSAFSVGRCC